MSHEALIRIAPLLNCDRYGNPEWEREGRDSYWGGSLRLLRREGVPLLVNHDNGRQIGTVHALHELDCGGGDKWVCASATVTDPPTWLRKGTPASFRRYNVFTVESVKGAKRVGSAFVGEVSVLPPGVEPAEPLARVMLMKRTQPEPAPRSRVDLTADPEAAPWLRQAQAQAAARGRIVRVTGQILGIR